MLATARRAANVVVAVVAIGVFLAVVVLFWLVRFQGWTIQTVASGSMAPAMPTGSVILSRPVAAQDVAIGDVIVFVSPVGGTLAAGDDGVFKATKPMLVTHRVVGIEGSGAALSFRTKGDANEGEDPWLIEAQALRARYVAHVPYVGTILASTNLRRTLYLVIAAIGIAVIVAESRSIAAELRRRRTAAEAAAPDDVVPDHVVSAPPPRSQTAPARHRR